MAGEIRELVPRSDFNFGPITANAPAFTIPIAQNADISRWRECTLIVRVHANQIASTGTPTAKVEVRPVAPTAEDPAVFFRGASSLATATIIPSNGPGFVHQVPLAANAGGTVSIFLVIAQGNQTAQFNTTLSVELDLKD